MLGLRTYTTMCPITTIVSLLQMISQQSCSLELLFNPFRHKDPIPGLTNFNSKLTIGRNNIFIKFHFYNESLK